jgi:4-amino-4-deoxy-L-arabinose transferase-like glycosyltransferase
MARQVGLFSGLVLISNYHFVNLACTARSDMMLCLFVSLSLLFFLYAYREPVESAKNLHVLFAFVCLGFGTITKGPVAPSLVFLIVCVFLLLKKDLKWCASAPLAQGIMIWLLITLAWFVPALMEGGREFFDIVLLDETINRFLGAGARTPNARPFYYLLGHFMGRFMPWSFFVAIALLWRLNLDKAERSKALFLYVWFFSVLAFFSISKGKRSDYLLPLYPAASLIVAQLWVSHFDSAQNGRCGKYMRAISAGYLGGCTALAVSTLALLVIPDPADAIARIYPNSYEKAALLSTVLNARTVILLLTALPLVAVSAVGIAFGVKGKFQRTLVTVLIAVALTTTLYFHFLSSKAMRGSGRQKKEFCARAAAIIGASESIKFLNVKNSVLFYMRENSRPLTREEALRFLAEADSPFLITTVTDFHELSRQADFEITMLDESEYLAREKQKYVLLGTHIGGAL